MIMAVLSFFYTLASFRINITLVITFFFITMAFVMLMAAYWVVAEGNAKVGLDLQIVRTPSYLEHVMVVLIIS